MLCAVVRKTKYTRFKHFKPEILITSHTYGIGCIMHYYVYGYVYPSIEVALLTPTPTITST
jgi:hypothetical protein